MRVFTVNTSCVNQIRSTDSLSKYLLRVFVILGGKDSRIIPFG